MREFIQDIAGFAAICIFLAATIAYIAANFAPHM